MAWIDITTATGQTTAAGSVPVVVATDDVLSTDINMANQLDEIRTALMSIANARGVLADLRVTPTGTFPTTIVSGTSVVTNLTQVGGAPANSVVQDWENQTYTSTFTANITRP